MCMIAGFLRKYVNWRFPCLAKKKLFLTRKQNIKDYRKNLDYCVDIKSLQDNPTTNTLIYNFHHQVLYSLRSSN